jgi:hypothetical protein
VRSLVAFASAVLLLACAEKAEKRVAPVLGSSLADAAPNAEAADPRFVELAKAARDAATKVAKACNIRGEGYEQHRRYHDDCTVKPPDMKALRESTHELGRAAPDAGASALFAEHVRLFTESVERSPSRGILAHYQELARGWNTFQPGDPIPVDLIVKVPTYDEGMLNLVGDAGALTWTRCSEGRCVIVPNPPSRR